MSPSQPNTEPTRNAPSSARACRRPRPAWAIGATLPALFGLAVTTGCGSADLSESAGLTQHAQTTTTESHKNFQTFEYTQTPGLTFDSEPGALSHVTITRLPGGSYWLDLHEWAGDSGGESRFTWEQLLGDAEWISTDGWPDDGWDSSWSWQTPTDQELPPRALTAAEVQRMLSVFASIPVEYEYVEADIDYYCFEDVRWDERNLSANPNYGYSETIAYTKLAEIVQMLKDFAAATER